MFWNFLSLFQIALTSFTKLKKNFFLLEIQNSYNRYCLLRDVDQVERRAGRNVCLTPKSPLLSLWTNRLRKLITHDRS